MIGGHRGKKRLRKAEGRLTEADQKLDDKIERHKAQTAEDRLHQAELERRLREQSERLGYVESNKVSQRLEQSTPQPVEVLRQPEKAPRPQPVDRTYRRELSDNMSVEERLRRTVPLEERPVATPLEQERRHEVKDEPGKLPTAYMQPAQQVPADQIPAGSGGPSAPGATRSHLVSLGGPMVSPLPQPAKAVHHTSYKKAIISGAVTALVIIGVLIAIVVL
jgi:hypothetical protein